jgi:hypothetical protein
MRVVEWLGHEHLLHAKHSVLEQAQHNVTHASMKMKKTKKHAAAVPTSTQIVASTLS